MRSLVLILILALAAGAAFAGTPDIKCTADTTRSLTIGLGNPVGPSQLTFVTDGKAVVKLLWFRDSTTARGGAQVVDSTYVYLRDYTPPRTYSMPSGADSMVIDMVTATELLIVR
jgi:hypothetical protein